MKLTIKQIAVGSPAYEQELEIRDLVLRKPIGRSIAQDDLSGEQQCTHFGIFEGDRLLGTLYLKEESDRTMRVKQVAVREEWRKCGLGSKLFAYLFDYCRARGVRTLRLDARADASGFYQKLGFQKTGETVYYFRLPHFCMKKEL